MDEKAGQSEARLALYAGSIGVVLLGLGILTRGELAAARPRAGRPVEADVDPRGML